MSELSEAERALITQVALRERWRDPRNPPTHAPGPRSLPEQAAISRYQAALRPPARTPGAASLRRRRQITLAILILACVAGVVACLMVSVTQTLFGLLGGAVFGLWSWRRARRRRTA